MGSADCIRVEFYTILVLYYVDLFFATVLEDHQE
jgi:hypothetical protein